MNNKYKYDLHVHTSETSNCGKVNARELVKMYSKAGYTGIAITDHYYEGCFRKIADKLQDNKWESIMDVYMQGYREAVDQGEKEGLDIIFGIELRFDGSSNDYLVYGISENFLLENPKLYKLDLRKFRELIQGRDILVYQAHPFRPNMEVAEPSLLDGVEVYNGNPRHNSNNALAYELAMKNNLAMISGSDFHQEEDLARGGIIVDQRLSDSTELARLLKSCSKLELIKTE